MAERSKPFWEGDLYKLLDARIVGFCRAPRGQLSIASLADRMGYSSEGLYKYLRADELTMNGALALFEACDGLVAKEELEKFMPHKFKD